MCYNDNVIDKIALGRGGLCSVWLAIGDGFVGDKTLRRVRR